jgi:hypothetical protein
MTILLDGLYEFGVNYYAIVVFLLTAFGLGAWLTKIIPESKSEYNWIIPLNLGLGCILLSLLAFGLLILAQLESEIPVSIGMWLVVLFALGGIILEWRHARPMNVHSTGIGTILLGLGSFLLLLVIRLAYIRPLLLPPYNDSPEHYQIVQGFLYQASGINNLSSPLAELTNRYYHLGYHSIAAWLVLVSGGKIESTLALSGQLLLVISPFTLMAFTAVVTKDNRAAWFVALLSGIGWKMPAFAADWGKYPAITGIVTLPAVLGIWYLIAHRSEKRPGAWLLLVLLSAGVVFIHTRALICLLLAASGFLIAAKTPINRGLRFWEGILAAIPIVILFFLFREPLQGLYCDGWCTSFVLVLLLLPFAFQAFPRFSIGVGVYLLGAYVAAQLRLPAPFNTYSPVFLDRTFIEISLYLPLALLGGAGMAGLIRKVAVARKVWLLHGLTLLLVSLVIGNALFYGSFYPDQCCNYVRGGDLDAFRWIETQTPKDAVIVISGFRDRNYMIGTDAGIWIHALTGRNVNRRSFDMDWTSIEVMREICRPKSNDVFLYQGGREYSFNQKDLNQQNWYRIVFESGRTRIYQVVGCRNVEKLVPQTENLLSLER